MFIQFKVQLRLLQEGRVIFETGQSWSLSEPISAVDQKMVIYTPPMTTNVQTLEFHKQEIQPHYGHSYPRVSNK